MTLHSTQYNKPDSEVEAVVRQLVSSNPKARELASETISQMGPQVIQVMDAMLKVPLHFAKSESRRASQAYGLTVLLSAIIIWLIQPFRWSGISNWDLLFWDVCAALFFPLPVLLYYINSSTDSLFPKSQPTSLEGLKLVVKSLSHSDNQYAAVALIEVLHLDSIVLSSDHRKWLSAENIDEAHHAFIRLSSRLEAKDSVWLSRQHREHLLVCLKHYSQFVFNSGPGADGTSPGVPRTQFDLPMTLAILKIYQQLPDHHALGYVKRLSNAWRWNNHCWEVGEIQSDARECLPFIEQATSKENVRRNLLRPSNGTNTTSENLLRSAAPVSEEEGQQLLRASEQESEE